MGAYSFTRAGEAWAISAWDVDPLPAAGETVTVRKRDGEEREVRVGDLLSRDGRKAILEILPAEPAAGEEEPAQGPDKPGPEELPAGRYAIENQDGELRFYKLWRGDRRPEYTKLYVLHGPDDSEVPFKSALSIMRGILEAGPRACAVRYGHEIGECSVCGLRLTNKLSRELAIGPVCGGRYWEADEWTQVKAKARERIRARGEDPEDTYDPTLPAEGEEAEYLGEPMDPGEAEHRIAQDELRSQTDYTPEDRERWRREDAMAKACPPDDDELPF